METLSTQTTIEYYPGIRECKPKFPDYALLCARLKSFSSWSSGKISNPETLSKAGLFFSGKGDLVICFFCGGSLKDWQNEDVPWVEHARWFPNCKYVKLCKGENFVNVCHTADNTKSINISKQLELMTKENIPDDWMVRKLISDKANTILASVFGQGEDKKYDVLPNPNLVLRGSNFQLPEETRRLATDELKRIEREEAELREENRKLRDIFVCKVCLDSQASIVFIPCGHFVSCDDCSTRLDTCAICRSQIQRKVFAQ